MQSLTLSADVSKFLLERDRVYTWFCNLNQQSGNNINTVHKIWTSDS